MRHALCTAERQIKVCPFNYFLSNRYKKLRCKNARPQQFSPIPKCARSLQVIIGRDRGWRGVEDQDSLDFVLPRKGLYLHFPSILSRLPWTGFQAPWPDNVKYEVLQPSRYRLCSVQNHLRVSCLHRCAW